MITTIALLIAAQQASAQPAGAHSTQLATELNQLLTARGLDAIAASDPAAPNRFVAALAFSKSELLVVGAAYPAPPLLLQQIAAAKYHDVYEALQQSGVADGRLFFLDLGYDGLRGTPDAVDVLYEGPTNELVFDGSPEKHKLTKAAYEKQLASAEATYSHLLTVLIGHLKESGTP
jgi:hypothetical protein